MYLLLLLLFPLLYLVNPYLAMGGLIAGSSGCRFPAHTGRESPPPKRPVESSIKAGYGSLSPEQRSAGGGITGRIVTRAFFPFLRKCKKRSG